MLDLAARSAWRAVGDVEPNPLVGCVIARGDSILGVGHHRRFGGLHAEREALAACMRNGKDPRGAIAYVTLEPCCHTGKQPPCTDALIEAGIAQVVCARPDPHEESGGGAHILRSAGVGVEYTDASTEAIRLSDPFVHRVRTGLPWVTAKWAQTIDGRIATRTGESQWISSEQSRARVHRLRARVDVILTALGTVHADDPMLTPRGVRRIRRMPRRVVIDSDLDLPLDAALVRTARQAPTTVICATELMSAKITQTRRNALAVAGVEVLGVDAGQATAGWLDLEAALRLLVDRHETASVLIEAGPGLVGSMLEAGLINEAVVYIAPMVLGDEMAKSAAVGRVAATLGSGVGFELARVKRVGNDVELVYRRPVE